MMLPTEFRERIFLQCIWQTRVHQFAVTHQIYHSPRINGQLVRLNDTVSLIRLFFDVYLPSCLALPIFGKSNIKQGLKPRLGLWRLISLNWPFRCNQWAILSRQRLSKMMDSMCLFSKSHNLINKYVVIGVALVCLLCAHSLASNCVCQRSDFI